MSHLKWAGTVVEVGDLDSGSRGLLIEVRPNVCIEVSGFARHDIMAMPNLAYKKVEITIEVKS